ncbi:hypothetical protein Ancab_031418 [Ancistrocladus abbreviatus]
MGGSSAFLRLACVVLAMAVAGPSAEAAMTCSTVNKVLVPCMSYLKGSSREPSSGCCAAVRTLKGMAKTPADHRTACNWLKSTAASMSRSLNTKNAAALPGRCGVSVSYSISPTTDCSKVK